MQQYSNEQLFGMLPSILPGWRYWALGQSQDVPCSKGGAQSWSIRPTENCGKIQIQLEEQGGPENPKDKPDTCNPIFDVRLMWCVRFVV